MARKKQEIEGYKGLTRVEASLPTHFYLDAEHYEKELRRIWYRNWVYVCRASELDGPRAYRLFDLGSQQILILRGGDGQLRAFHNTCRHRGSVLVQEEEGRLRSPLIICPYHSWAYDLEGRLQRTPTRREQDDFDKADYPLYDIAVRDWNGFLFIHLDPNPAQSLEESFDDAHLLDNWHLGELEVGHTYRKTLECNWKVFWENFNECLHCPNIHPVLSQIVPLYKQYFMEVGDDPDWEVHQREGNPLYKAGLAEGKETWSTDGAARAEYFPDLTPEEIERGHNYCETLPSVFIVGHVDYVRAVRILPLGPERTEIHAQWLFRKETLADPAFDPAELARFAEGVIDEDGAASELNQKGLHSIRHEHGTLLAEEYSVYAFQAWVRGELG
jgi:Rieske 2Fe-2S family protein